MDDYKEFERKVGLIREENEVLLEDFDSWLSSKGLSEKTVEKHLNNAEFYIDEYLVYEEPIPAAKGPSHINMFMGYWFPRKAAWASSSQIKEISASLKKFYEFMQEQGKIDAKMFRDLKETIKEEMPEWLDAMEDSESESVSERWDIW